MLKSNRTKFILFTLPKNISFVLVLMLVFTLSCNQPKSLFNVYYTEMKQSKFLEEFEDYSLIPIRGAYQLFLPDSTRLQFDLLQNKEYKLNWVDPPRNYDTTIISKVILRCNKFHIISFERNNVFSTFSIYFDLKYLQEESLPKYQRHERDITKDGFWLGVLEYAYSPELYEKSGEFRYYNPVKVDSNWCYSETYFLKEHIPRSLL